MNVAAPWLDSSDVKSAGPVEAVYSPKRLELVRFWLAIIGLPLFLIGALTPLVILFVAPPQIPDKRLGIFICTGIFGTAAVIFGVLVPIQWRRAKQRLILAEQGIVFWLPNKATVIPWTNLESLFTRELGLFSDGGGFVRMNVWLTLRGSDGAEIRVSDCLAGIGDFEKRVEEQLLRRKLPQVLERLSTGQIVSFGSISLSRDAFYYKDDCLRFQDVESINIKTGTLVISPGNHTRRSIKVGLDTVANVAVFLPLVQELVGK